MRFPSSVIASLFGFAQRQYFNAISGSEQAPQVKF
ncbi:MAG: LemA family protein [Candidatus Taylorbacteria bacterium]